MLPDRLRILAAENRRDAAGCLKAKRAKLRAQLSRLPAIVDMSDCGLTTVTLLRSSAMTSTRTLFVRLLDDKAELRAVNGADDDATTGLSVDDGNDARANSGSRPAPAPLPATVWPKWDFHTS